jgi:DNA-binding PadR family transcriptional regulator
MSTSVHLAKPTAYRLLNQMEEDGWVMFYEEQESNHPTRRVFSITPDGERVFQENLRACLAAYTPAEYQNITCAACFSIVAL